MHAASRHVEIAASIVSVYANLRGVELTTSQGVVRHINCLAASEHRLNHLAVPPW